MDIWLWGATWLLQHKSHAGYQVPVLTLIFCGLAFLAGLTSVSFIIKLSQLRKPKNRFEVWRAPMTHRCEPSQGCCGYLHERSTRDPGPLQLFCFIGLLAFCLGHRLRSYSSTSPLNNCLNFGLKILTLIQAPLSVSVLNSDFSVDESELWISMSSCCSSHGIQLALKWKEGCDRVWVMGSWIERQGIWAGGFWKVKLIHYQGWRRGQSPG